MSEQMLKSLSQIEIETLCIVTAVKKDIQLTHFTQIANLQISKVQQVEQKIWRGTIIG